MTPDEIEKQREEHIERAAAYAAEGKYITPIGDDLTEYVVDERTAELFFKLVTAQINSIGPLPLTYKYVIEALNLECDLKGKPHRAFEQNPNLN